MAIVHELTVKEFESSIKSGVSLIDFFAEWCMPCMMMVPILEDIHDEFLGKLNIGKINVDDHPELAEKYGVNSIPTFIIFHDGKVVEELNGSMTQDELSEIIKKYL